MLRAMLLTLALTAIGCADQQNATDMEQSRASEAAREESQVAEVTPENEGALAAEPTSEEQEAEPVEEALEAAREESQEPEVAVEEEGALAAEPTSEEQEAEPLEDSLEAAREDPSSPELESVAEPVGSPPTEDGISRMIIILLLMMIGVTAISSITSLYLYWWRRKLTDGQKMFVSEKLLQTLDKMHASDKEAVNKLHSLSQSISDSKESTSDSISGLRKTFLTFRDGVHQRDAQIKKFEAGYDVVILRKHLRRFLLVEDAISEARREFPGSTEALNKVQKSLESAFDECEIERFKPPIGKLASELGRSVTDDPDLVESEDQSPGTIARVDKDGVRVRIRDEEWAVIRPAEVAVYQAPASNEQKEGR